MTDKLKQVLVENKYLLMSNDLDKVYAAADKEDVISELTEALYTLDPTFVKYMTSLPHFFAGGSPMFETFTVPENITKLGPATFAFCKNLKECTFEEPSKISLIPDRCFAICPSLKHVKLPEHVVELGTLAFYGCDIEEIDIPNSVRVIDDYCFDSCRRLKTIAIPEGVVTIQKGTFKDCTRLEYLELPSTIREIESQAFENCSNLEIVFTGTKEQWLSIKKARGWSAAFFLTGIACTDGPVSPTL